MSKLTQREDIMLYGKLAQRKLGYVAGQLELTSACGQRCVACDSWRQHRKRTIIGSLSWDLVNRLFYQLNQMPTFEHLTLTGGDPQHWQEGDLDLDHVLNRYVHGRYKFSLQVNTALTKKVCQPNLWRQALKRVRVSLDAATQKTYRYMRGDNRDPQEIIDRMDEMKHPGMSTMTCVTDRNIDEVPEIIDKLNEMSNPPRKAMFLPAMQFKKSDNFWRAYSQLKKIYSPKVALSFSEEVEFVRTYVRSEQAKEVPCYAGAVSFHIKCNGDVYPCCLVGGEAVKTVERLKQGNINKESLAQIQEEYKPICRYKHTEECLEVCQWKQLQLNRIAHEASKTFLTMP